MSNTGFVNFSGIMPSFIARSSEYRGMIPGSFTLVKIVNTTVLTNITRLKQNMSVEICSNIDGAMNKW